MPLGLKRFQQAHDLHFITFSCYRRRPKLGTGFRRFVFEEALEQTRGRYGFLVTGYVVMPEHVHLLVSEPPDALLSRAIQALKQSVSRRLALRAKEPFWQARYYNFNVWSEPKRIEKLRYMHRKPVKRGLATHPHDWLWSRYRHYATGVEGMVEIESQWTFRRKERMGITPQMRIVQARKDPAKQSLAGAPLSAEMGVKCWDGPPAESSKRPSPKNDGSNSHGRDVWGEYGRHQSVCR